MFGEPWRLYVYRSYGVHFCVNVVTGPLDRASAVLIRAGEVVDGVAIARDRRGLRCADESLARGPGNLARALGLTLDDLGTNLQATDGVHLGPPIDEQCEISAGPRVGVSKAADVPWRFWITNAPSVSAYRRSPRAP